MRIQKRYILQSLVRAAAIIVEAESMKKKYCNCRLPTHIFKDLHVRSYVLPLVSDLVYTGPHCHHRGPKELNILSAQYGALYIDVETKFLFNCYLAIKQSGNFVARRQ